MSKYIFKLFLAVVTGILLNACDCNIDTPENLHCGFGGGSICAVYNYVGGISYGATVYLDWEDVPDAEGYNVYVKNSNREYVLKETRDVSNISIGQGSGTRTYVVTAFTGECESDYSEEYSFTVY